MIRQPPSAGRISACTARRGLAAAAAAALLLTVDLSAQQGLTGAPLIAGAYDTIFDARFEELPRRLDETCPPAPEEVCTLLDAIALWWEIQLDPNDPSRDDEFEARADAAVAAAEEWTVREPERAEAWFYLGGAFGARAQWRVLRGARLAAARDGKRIKNALERALELDPSLQDAYFGIGLYHYYADVAPAGARLLRWLLLLPGGDRTAGMEEMLRARREGQLLRSEADYQLHLIHLWYEQEPERALELLRGLHERHPRNPHFVQRIAYVQDVYFHDADASLATWQDLLQAANQGRVARPDMARAAARLGIATALDVMDRTRDAVPHLRAIIASDADAPHGIVAEAQLRLAQALDRIGTRDGATAAYRAALDAAPEHDPDRIAERAREALRQR